MPEAPPPSPDKAPLEPAEQETIIAPPESSQESSPDTEQPPPEDKVQAEPDPAAELTRLVDAMFERLTKLPDQASYLPMADKDVVLVFSLCLCTKEEVVSRVRGSATLAEILHEDLLPAAQKQVQDVLAAQVTRPLLVRWQAYLQRRAQENTKVEPARAVSPAGFLPPPVLPLPVMAVADPVNAP